MRLFIPLCFAVLAVLYWVVSGGPGFVPEAGPRQASSAGSAEGAAAGAPAADGAGEGRADGPAEATDVAVTRAESATADLVAPPPEPGALSLQPAAAGAAEPAEATEPRAAATPEPTSGPEGLPETPVAPEEALAALVPGLAVPAAEPDAAPDALVDAAASDGAPDARREVAGDRVNLRDGPGTSFPVVGRLARGEAAEVLERRGDWARVRVGANEGWMSERFLAP